MDLWLLFFKKRLCPQRIVIIGKIFRTRDFHFKIRFGVFWVDSDRRKFPQNFLSLRCFSTYAPSFWKTAMFPEKSNNGKKFQNWGFYSNIFWLFWIDSAQKFTKNFLVEKSLIMNFLYPLLEHFIVVLLIHHTLMYLYPARSARFCSFYPALPPH